MVDQILEKTLKIMMYSSSMGLSRCLIPIKPYWTISGFGVIIVIVIERIRLEMDLPPE